MYDESLPYTSTGLVIGGYFIGLPLIISIAVALILGSLIVYRLFTRNRRRA